MSYTRIVKLYDWNEEKNEELKRNRHVSFDDVIEALHHDKWLDVIEHPNKKRYPNQYILIVAIKQYAYMVPFVLNKEKYFLKTIIPSRKMTKKYLKGGEYV